MDPDNPDQPADVPPSGEEAEETPANVEEAPVPASASSPPPGTQPRGLEDLSPTPSGEDLPPEETKKIITLTNDILQRCQRKVDDQKIGSHSLSFMLLRIKESLHAYYKDYIPKLNTFLCHAEKITAEHYVTICCRLPQYGDYVKAIEAEDCETVDIGMLSPVSKQELLKLVQDVTDNYMAAAMFIKTGRGTYKDINSQMQERKDIVHRVEANMPEWMKLQDTITTVLEDIREQTFKISAYLDFLRQGESKTSPILDLSLLNQTTKARSGSKTVTVIKPEKSES